MRRSLLTRKNEVLDGVKDNAGAKRLKKIEEQMAKLEAEKAALAG